jgi:tetratricopeptide (TPR) repeat protein
MRSAGGNANAGSPRWTTFAAAAAIAGAVVMAYADSFSGRFYSDDNPTLVANASIRQLWPPRVPLMGPAHATTGGRPLANLSFALNYAVGGLEPGGYHAVNLLIHVCAALALFGTARRLLVSPGLRGRFGGDATLAATLIAGLWALHPLQTEAVTYVVQRVESLMGMFFLLTLYCFTRFADGASIGSRPLAKEKNGAREGRKREGRVTAAHLGPPNPAVEMTAGELRSIRPAAWNRWAWLALGSCLLGVATKEVMALAPLMVLLCDRTFYAGSFAAAWRRRGQLHLALMATWIPLALLVASTGWNRGGSAGFDVGVRPSAYWFTQFEAVTRYLRLAAWPHPLVFDYGTFWRTPAQAWPYALAVVPLGLVALLSLWRWPVAGFLGFWFFAILAPTSLIPGTFQMIVEHRMYLSLAAVAAAVVGVAHRVAGRRGLLVLVPAAVVLGVLTYRRNGEYGSDFALWSANVAARPGNSRGHNNLGNAYLAEGRVDQAEACYREAIRLDPNSADGHSNLGALLLRTGRSEEAIRECARAVALKPKQGVLHLFLGEALLAGGRTKEAIAEYAEAVRLAPANLPALVSLGGGLAQQGQLSDAAEAFRAAARAQPMDATVHNNLGAVLWRLGRSAEALEEFRTAVRLKPDFGAARQNLEALGGGR